MPSKDGIFYVVAKAAFSVLLMPPTAQCSRFSQISLHSFDGHAESCDRSVGKYPFLGPHLMPLKGRILSLVY